MLMVGEVKTAKSLLKNLQQTVMVVTKIQKTESSDSKNINEWYEYSLVFGNKAELICTVIRPISKIRKIDLHAMAPR